MRILSRKQQQGFTLIEVLVAFSILVMSLTVLFRIFSIGLSNLSYAEYYADATTLAQDLIEGDKLSLSNQGGSDSGMNNGIFRWNRVVFPYEKFDPTGSSQRNDLYVTQVKVNWMMLGQERSLALSSLMLIEPDVDELMR
jgi:general secretion pathway protein I